MQAYNQQTMCKGHPIHPTYKKAFYTDYRLLKFRKVPSQPNPHSQDLLRDTLLPNQLYPLHKLISYKKIFG